MSWILVPTSNGCRAISAQGDERIELVGRRIGASAPDGAGALLAVVDDSQIWRRSPGAEWSLITDSGVSLEAILSVRGEIFVGSTDGAVLFRVTSVNEVNRVTGFDSVPGRNQWVGNGPPLQVRSLTATADGNTILAAVHVGGIPRSTDGGRTWRPTVPMDHDVHEVCAHPSSPMVAAAAAVGLCVSDDSGANWRVISDGLEITNSLAVAVLPHEVLFSIQDGPFAERSQLWRWQIGGPCVEQVRDGLPLWLKGKVDTAHIAAHKGRAALVDKGGDLWLSESGSSGWSCIATDLQDAQGVQFL